MIRIPHLPFAILAATLALPGCSTSGSSFVGTYYGAYQQGDGRTVASEGPMPVTLTGAPFPDADVVAALNAISNIYQIKFTTDQKPGRSGYRLALNFGTNQPIPARRTRPLRSPSPQVRSGFRRASAVSGARSRARPAARRCPRAPTAPNSRPS